MRNLYIALIVFINTSLCYADWQKDFQSAYDSGQYPIALEVLLKNKSEASPQDHYHLGNVYYRLKKIGKATYHFELAHALAPKDSDILYNLKLTQMAYSDQLGGGSLDLSSNWKNQLAEALPFDFLINSTGWIIWFTIASMLLPYYRTRKWTRAISHPLAILGVLLTASLSILSIIVGFSELGNSYLLKQDSIIRSGPGEKFIQIKEAYIGMRLRKTGQVRESLKKETWDQIKFSDGQVGWILETDLQALPSPKG